MIKAYFKSEVIESPLIPDFRDGHANQTAAPSIAIADTPANFSTLSKRLLASALIASSKLTKPSMNYPPLSNISESRFVA